MSLVSISLRHGRRPLGVLLVATAIAAVSLMTMGCGPAKAASSGPVTVYTSPSSAPTPGALYGRALQLHYAGSSNGYLLATFEQYTSGTPVFPIFRSTNGGASWSQLSSIADTQNGWGLRYQPMLYELPQAIGSMAAGTILAVGNSIPNDLSKTQLDMYKSTDHGQSWSFVSHIASGGKADPTNGQTPVWEPFLVAANNKLIVYYSDQRDPAYGQKIVHQTTTNGTTWTAAVNDVAVSPYAARPGMPVVAQMGNGQWVMTYEYGGSPQGNFAPYIKIASNPENFGAATGNVINAGGVQGQSSPYVVWVNNGKNGELVVSTGNSGTLFVNKSYGATGSWTTLSSRTPQGYSRSLVVLNDNHSVLGISAGPLGSGHNIVKTAVDDLGTQ